MWISSLHPLVQASYVPWRVDLVLTVQLKTEYLEHNTQVKWTKIKHS